jgi:hypothetical protein
LKAQIIGAWMPPLISLVLSEWEKMRKNFVRKAAERCAGLEANTHPLPEDVVVVGKAYLEDHPADEYELATRAWCVERGFDCGAQFQGDRWVPQVWLHDQWVVLPMVATRGDLLRLRKILSES